MTKETKAGIWLSRSAEYHIVTTPLTKLDDVLGTRWGKTSEEFVKMVQRAEEQYTAFQRALGKMYEDWSGLGRAGAPIEKDKETDAPSGPGVP